MTTQGTVRLWLDDEGWGVIDSPETPGGCWTHFSSVLVAGYHSLSPGQAVELEWEAFDQDGYPYRAVRVWPADQQPVVQAPMPAEPGGAYSSTLTFTPDRDAGAPPGSARPDASKRLAP